MNDPGWNQVLANLQKMRAQLVDLTAAEEDLRAMQPVLEQASPDVRRKWSDMLSRLHYGVDEVSSAIRTGEQEFRQFLLADSSSPVGRDMVRFLLQRSRQAIYGLEAVWEEIDNALTDRLIAAELERPAFGEDYWWSQWRDDAELAKQEMQRALAQSKQPRDEWMLRLKYERGLTQQQIADLLNVAQSTVANRLARIEESIAEGVALSKVSQMLVREGFHVMQVPPAAGFDIMVEGDGLRVAVEVRTANPEDMRPRMPTNREPRSDLRRLVRLFAGPRPSDNISLAVVAVYFRMDGSVGFYSAEQLLSYAESVPDFSISSLSRERLPPAWTLRELLDVRGR